MLSHSHQKALGKLFLNHRNELTLISYVEGVKPQEFAGTKNLIVHWNEFLLDLDAYSRLLGYLVN